MAQEGLDLLHGHDQLPRAGLLRVQHALVLGTGLQVLPLPAARELGAVDPGNRLLGRGPLLLLQPGSSQVVVRRDGVVHLEVTEHAADVTLINQVAPKYGKFAGHNIGRFGRDRCHPFV